MNKKESPRSLAARGRKTNTWYGLFLTKRLAALPHFVKFIPAIFEVLGVTNV